jgi:xanthosine utilization system XapX-like protein
LILDAPTWAAIVGILGIVNGALIGYRTVEFGRLMHSVIDTVAQRQHLTPVKSE